MILPSKFERADSESGHDQAPTVITLKRPETSREQRGSEDRNDLSHKDRSRSFLRALPAMFPAISALKQRMVVAERSRRRISVAALLTLVSATIPTTLAAQDGKTVYNKWCAGCHGDTGAGDGFGSKTMLPHPRDFTKAVYKIRTTASGEIPTDDDIRHIIEVGMPGTAMPEWKSRLNAGEITAVIQYLKSFSPNSFSGAAAKPIAIGKAPSGSGVDEGRAAFQKLECYKCHGAAGRADGKSAPTLKDDYGNPIRPADLTENWKFRGGNTVAAIYTRLRTGLDGTPMPSFQDAVENKLITDEQLWRVAQYVHSLSPEKPPEAREVVRAALAQTLPKTPDDAAWRNVERFWVPLVGQIVAKPRWFAPTIDGVWVQALHDGRSLALRVAWDDPSKSPDPAWDEWLGRMAKTLTDVDGPLATQQGPDRLVVQWARDPNDESRRPYFLGGDSKSPVYVWRWTSEPRVEEGTEAGLGKFTALPNGGATVSQTARYVDGQWQVVFTRGLASTDSTRPRFTSGHAIPVAFYAADGSSGEDDVRGAVSTWYAVYLDVPTPTRVFVAPIAIIALSAGLGMLLVTRAQRRDNGRGDELKDSSHMEER
jgi:DMSO reductase family type II enzyme heme b subunit